MTTAVATRKRMAVNSDEQQLITQARDLAKLQARRRRKAEELAALDAEIAAVSDVLRTLVPASSED